MKSIRVGKMVEELRLEILAGHEGLNRQIDTSALSRPGLELAGYVDHYPAERVQVLGLKELGFFQSLSPLQKIESLERLFLEETPCFVIAHGQEAPGELLEMAEKRQIPVLRSPLSTTAIISKLSSFLSRELAPSTTVHGVLVEIYGVGVLITGGSGVGKSETALELVKRGHRLVADDAVEIRQPAENVLIGQAPELIRHLLEIRGMGIIDVATLFGAGAIRIRHKVSIVCHLEIWDDQKQYDRLGLDDDKVKILDSYLPRITIPVRPGRNIAVIIEVAAMNYRLKLMGMNAAENFAHRLTEAIEGNEDYN